MKKTCMFKLVFYIIFIVITIFAFIYFISNLSLTNQGLLVKNSPLVFLLFPLFYCPLVLVLIFIDLFSLFSLNHSVKYNYEEYKEMRNKKESEKQAKNKQEKIENLKRQLNDLENTD